MRLIVALALCAASAVACSAPTAPPAVEAGPDPTFHVRLDRGMCLGDCPAYRVEIDASGLVSFTGSVSNMSPSVPCQGRRQWRVSPAAVAGLAALIDREDVFSFKDDYTAGVTDRPGFDVTVTRRGKTKHVHDYAGEMVAMPRAVSEVEDAIDIAANDKACVVATVPATNAS
jgi:hypothetical protein